MTETIVHRFPDPNATPAATAPNSRPGNVAPRGHLIAYSHNPKVSMRRQVEGQLVSLRSWDEHTGLLSTEGLGWTEGSKNLQGDKANVTCRVVADHVEEVETEMPGFLPKPQMTAGHKGFLKESRRAAKGKKRSRLPGWIYKDSSGTKAGADSEPKVASYVTIEKRGPNGELIDKYTTERGEMFKNLERHSAGRVMDLRFYDPSDEPEEEPKPYRAARIDVKDMMAKAKPAGPSELNPPVTPYEYMTRVRRAHDFDSGRTAIVWEKNGKQYRATEEISRANTIYTRRTGEEYSNHGGLNRKIITLEVLDQNGRPGPQIIFSENTEAKGASPRHEDRPGKPHSNPNKFEAWFNGEMLSGAVTDLRLEHEVDAKQELHRKNHHERIEQIKASADATQLQAFQWLGNLTANQDFLGERSPFGPEMSRLLDRGELSKEQAINLMIPVDAKRAEVAAIRNSLEKDGSIAEAAQDMARLYGRENFFRIINELQVRYINTLNRLKLSIDETTATDTSWIVRGLATEYANAEGANDEMAGNTPIVGPVGYTPQAVLARKKVFMTKLGQDMLDHISPMQETKIPTSQANEEAKKIAIKSTDKFIIVKQRPEPSAGNTNTLQSGVRSRIIKLAADASHKEINSMLNHKDIDIGHELEQIGWLAAHSVGMD